MQRIERYGVIALVLLLVTIAAVSFWDDGSTTEAAQRGGGAAEERVAQTAPAQRPGASSRSASGAGRLPATADLRPAQEPRKTQSGRSTRPRPKPAAAGFEELPSKIVERPAAHETSRPTSEEQDVVFPRIDFAGERPAPQPAPDQGRPDPAPAVRPVQPATPPAVSAQKSTYTVKSGDSLSAIASRELGSKARMDELAALNGITDANRIYEGQVLKLPTGRAPAGALRTVELDRSMAIPPADPSGRYHVVQAGESLSVIAEKLLGSYKRMDEIMALNPGLNPDRVFEGQRLRVPAEAGLVASAATAPRATRGSAGTARGRISPSAGGGGNKVR